MKLKKILFTTSLLFITLNLSITTFAATTSPSNSSQIKLQNTASRGPRLIFNFKNYPPKTYKGLNLILVRKTPNGYSGIYQ
ncbi:hypothetical protein [Vagococcus silagei]|uniref:Uncharacterized protein n=1 Tax=Vagococcus silagei TaxID=2508885 RepID=A0A4S3B470_9ENTE|nr:hypothetical protein [Vagococcus silagei]THB60580.1 hypothetical protein ESZ54_09565 [Vagococcus silagei]